MKMRSVVILTVVVALGIAGVFVAQEYVARNYEFNGSIIYPAMTVDDFSITHANGDVFQLSQQQGKVVVMFFGYTSCPDFCPTTLVEYKQAHNDLAELSEEIVFVFVSVDPARDTPEKVDVYVRNFNEDFIGLSGTEEELAPIYKSFFVTSEIVDEGSAAGYTVIHSTRTIVIDKNGGFRMTFPYGLGVSEMVSDLRHLIQE